MSASSRSWVTKTTVRSPRPGCPKEVLHVSPNERVERAEGLIHQEYLLLGRERPREPDPLLHTAGELGYELAALPPGRPRQRLLGLPPALLRGDALDLEAKAMLSSTVRFGKSPKCWKTMPIFLRRTFPSCLEASRDRSSSR